MTLRIFNRLFGSHPVATHCPGPPHRRWQQFVTATLNQPRRSVDCDDVTVVTWNTGGETAKPCGLLESSLELLGVTPRVLAQGRRNWVNRDKLKSLAEALSTIETPYLIGADSADVLFLDSPAIVVERFRRHFTASLVFNSTGSTCWPDLPALAEFQSSLPMAAVAQGRHWINSGLFVGETRFCREYFSQLADHPPVRGFQGSDQAIVMETWPRWYPRVQADYFCQLFQWFNEEPEVMWLQRPLAERQRQLIDWVRRLPMPATGVEVGVFRGNTSEALLREFPQLTLWLVDPWRPFDGASTFDSRDQAAFDEDRDAAMYWTDFARQRRHAIREPSPAAASRFADHSLDFAFLDGNHLYEQVCQDIQAWWPKVREGGLLTGHDYGVYGDRDGRWGVRRAVDEFAAAIGRDPELGDDGMWGMKK